MMTAPSPHPDDAPTVEMQNARLNALNGFDYQARLLIETIDQSRNLAMGLARMYDENLDPRDRASKLALMRLLEAMGAEFEVGKLDFGAQGLQTAKVEESLMWARQARFDPEKAYGE